MQAVDGDEDGGAAAAPALEAAPGVSEDVRGTELFVESVPVNHCRPPGQMSDHCPPPRRINAIVQITAHLPDKSLPPSLTNRCRPRCVQAGSHLFSSLGGKGFGDDDVASSAAAAFEGVLAGEAAAVEAGVELV